MQSACRGPAGAPLEHQDWHDGRRERLTVDRVAYRVRQMHVFHDSRPLGSGAHLAAVNGYRSSGGGGEEGSRHDIRDHFAGRLNETCEIQVFSFCYSGPLIGRSTKKISVAGARCDGFDHSHKCLSAGASCDTSRCKYNVIRYPESRDKTQYSTVNLDSRHDP